VTKLIMRLERLADAAARTPALHVVDLRADDGAAGASTPLSTWMATVAGAHDACLLLDDAGRVLAMSAAAAQMLGCADGGVIGRRLLDVVDVVDFDSGTSGPDYATRIAPVGVLGAGGGLMRSLMRVRQRDGGRATIDVAAAPLHDDASRVVGSLSFLAAVGSRTPSREPPRPR
jgi:PAS domain-containing protein